MNRNLSPWSIKCLFACLQLSLVPRTMLLLTVSLKVIPRRVLYGFIHVIVSVNHTLKSDLWRFLTINSVWYSNITEILSRAAEVQSEINCTYLTWMASFSCKYFIISHGCLLYLSVKLCFRENYKAETLVKNKFIFTFNLVRVGRYKQENKKINK